MSIKTRIEYGSPVSAFQIPNLFLTNREAYALIDLAKNAHIIDFGRENFQEDEYYALTSGICAVAEALEKAGWRTPA